MTPAVAHIAFMSVPLHGHVNPMLGVAAELTRRGHRVSFATGAGFESLIAETGATAVPYRSVLPAAGPDGAWLAADDDGRAAAALFRRERDHALPQIATAYADDRPDLVVYDTVTAHAPVLAARWQVPEVQFSPTHVFPRGSEELIGSPVRLAPPVTPCVVAMPRSLQIQAERTDPAHRFVGPVRWRRDADGDWSAPPGRRVAFVSLGTTYNRRTDVLARCAHALHADGWHVVVATGGDVEPARLGDLPAGVEVHRWVPQVRVLEQASVFVTAGGTGSVLEGLSHGVPLVVVPQGVEHFVTAARVEALGLGRTVRPEAFSADAVRDAVDAVVTSDRVRQALAAMRAEIEAAGGARAAADIVEAHLPADRRTPHPGEHLDRHRKGHAA
ncbi:glycosyltransferase [Solwaraspora sp. WMMD791]|uniref:nucleotide disphospho-sugar-binding domain-containing protein n=1 Tax=Solwaraspora sp. WMMD791 TaxID=3016086 RepID=UPI002499EA75|nr:nucleotide disphospho-sugar-binding domain-containing protein [Solwaraspora sp. WMMD791]WFE30326.1 glycosyltransferase [Solwaraspora sp. WMMD791]